MCFGMGPVARMSTNKYMSHILMYVIDERRNATRLKGMTVESRVPSAQPHFTDPGQPERYVVGLTSFIRLDIRQQD